ncbi:hypothetical protein PG984_005525 [Apiospora sp. TS-2023a]
MASPKLQPSIEMATMPHHVLRTKKRPKEETNQERECLQISTAYSTQAADSRTDLAEADCNDVAALLGTNNNYDAPAGTLQARTAEVIAQVALARSITKELAFELVCHLIALSFTLYLVSLSFTNYYLVDEHEWISTMYFAYLSQNDAMKALQFAAKTHEIFIIMSLLAMVLHLVRRRLAIQKGLSVGHLVSGYQIENLSLLFRRRLWNPTFNKPLQDPGTLVVTIVLFVSVLLAKLVGPASAILVLPSLQWWPVDNPFVG